MQRESLIKLTPEIYLKYWAYIPDSDIVKGTDGGDYIYSSAFNYYLRVKRELDATIGIIERGAYPQE